MKAVVITRFGGPEVLEIHDVPPGPEEVLVNVRSTALNRADLLQRSGRYAAPPGEPRNIPGLEYLCVLCVKGLFQRRGRKDTPRAAEKNPNRVPPTGNLHLKGHLVSFRMRLTKVTIAGTFDSESYLLCSPASP